MVFCAQFLAMTTMQQFQCVLCSIPYNDNNAPISIGMNKLSMYNDTVDEKCWLGCEEGLYSFFEISLLLIFPIPLYFIWSCYYLYSWSFVPSWLDCRVGTLLLPVHINLEAIWQLCCCEHRWVTRGSSFDLLIPFLVFLLWHQSWSYLTALLLWT